MKNVLLWIASIFSILLDAVKKSKLEIVTIQIPLYKMSDVNTRLELKGEKRMIIISSSIKNQGAWKNVEVYAKEHDLKVVGTYVEGSKRNFILAKIVD